jgi:transcription termination factor Rho
MSVEPQALERSVLERKSAEELQAIAEALGAKTPSRARKADLVDAILREAGVETAPPEGEAPERPKRTRAPRATKKDEDAPAAEAPEPIAAEPTGAEAPASAPQGAVAEALVEAVEASPDERAESSDDDEAEQRDEPEPRDQRDEHHQRDQRDQSDQQQRPPYQQQPQQGQPQDRQPQQQPQGQGQGQQGQGQQPGQEGEGNRRSNRRRRGRDRDRAPGGEREFQGQGQPGSDAPYTGDLATVEGLLDLRDEGFGFLRTTGFLPGHKDVYVSLSQVRRFALRKGDYIVGGSRPANTNEKYPALVRIDTVSGLTPEEARTRPRFEDLTPLFPDERLKLEMPNERDVTTRIVDLVSPIGKGQRGLIVSPPKAGKTTVMKQIAKAIEANNPEVELMVLLVDERPEEVTDMRRSVKGEVVASTFDRPSEEHTQVAELAIERAKRLVEMGKDVVIILDGITRLARAYNLAAPTTGRIMSGGIDTGALYPPKKFFGAARNVEEGGSLTILATALVETGSRMDEVIFEEFKGTGNMELRLDRKLAERRIYPALDVNASSTRREDLLFERKHLEMIWRLRRVLNGLSEGGSTAAGLELLVEKLRTTKSNEEFLNEIAKAPAPAV